MRGHRRMGVPLQGAPRPQQPDNRPGCRTLQRPERRGAERRSRAIVEAGVTGIDGEELSRAGTPDERALTRFHQRLLAEELLLRSGRATERLAGALSEARVDLNPHLVE